MKQTNLLFSQMLFVLFLIQLPPLKTTAQWNAIESGVQKHLQNIYFLDAEYGVAVGDTSTVLLTTDGGDSWLPIANRFKESFQSALILEKDVIMIAGGNFFRD